MDTCGHPPLLVLYSELPLCLEQIVNTKPLDSIRTKHHLFLSESAVFWKFFPSKYALEIPRSTPHYLQFCFVSFLRRPGVLQGFWHARERGKKKKGGRKDQVPFLSGLLLTCHTHFPKGHYAFIFLRKCGLSSLSKFCSSYFPEYVFCINIMRILPCGPLV